MSESQQSVLVGATYRYRGTTHWRAAGAVSTVRHLNSQLIDTALSDEFLINRSRSSALLYTHDGTHWTVVSLPKIDGVPVVGRPAPYGQVTTLALNGTLVAVLGSPLATTECLELL